MSLIYLIIIWIKEKCSDKTLDRFIDKNAQWTVLELFSKVQNTNIIL